MAARLAVVQCFGSRASVIFSILETVARRNAKQRFQSSLEEVWLAKDLLGDVRCVAVFRDVECCTSKGGHRFLW